MTLTTPKDITEITPEALFGMHPKIRCVELASEFGEPIFQRMRDGARSISPDELDDQFLAIGPQVITDFCKKYEPWYGPLNGIVVYHEKISILIVRVVSRFLVISFEPDTSAETIKEVSDDIRSKWGSRKEHEIHELGESERSNELLSRTNNP